MSLAFRSHQKMYNGHFQTLEESFRVIVTVSRLLGLLVMICTNFCRYQICERCEIEFESTKFGSCAIDQSSKDKRKFFLKIDMMSFFRFLSLSLIYFSSCILFLLVFLMSFKTKWKLDIYIYILRNKQCLLSWGI